MRLTKYNEGDRDKLNEIEELEESLIKQRLDQEED